MSKSEATFLSSGGECSIDPARLNDADPIARKLAQLVVGSEVHNELGKFNHTNNGVHAWRAYALARSAGLPIPDEVLTYLDMCACVATRAGSAQQVAAGMHLSNARGGSRKERAAAITDHQHKQLQALKMAYQNCGKGGKRAARVRVAEQFDTTEGALRQLWIKAGQVKKL